MKTVLIVKTGSALPRTRAKRGDFESWIALGMGLPADHLRVVSVFEGEALPDPSSVSGVVVTGSTAMVSHREEWSERSAAWIGEAVVGGTPLLAICYGHQLLAHALGGEVGENPRGREIGTVEVDLLPGAADDPLFLGLPPRLRVHATHVESVLDLPSGARPLAASGADPHHAFAYGDVAWGVQFHPEFDADVMRSYLDERREDLRSEGLDPEELIRAARDCPDATALLRRFAELLGV
jgi:GMP synthase (glutamine-hydrolysing)